MIPNCLLLPIRSSYRSIINEKEMFLLFQIANIRAINDQDVISFPSLGPQTLNACSFLPSKFSLFLRPTLEFF